VVSKGAIAEELKRAGWEVDYGFSGHLLIGNAGELSLLIPWWVWQDANPEYELYDVQRNLVCRVGTIPRPVYAAMLIEEHGEPAAGAEEDEAAWALL
jgi:hypothetical protein